MKLTAGGIEYIRTALSLATVEDDSIHIPFGVDEDGVSVSLRLPLKLRRLIEKYDPTLLDKPVGVIIERLINELLD